MGTQRRSRFVGAVLDAALAELASGGFDGLSVPAVAARAGVNKTSIYRRWPDKASLAGAALERASAAPGGAALSEGAPLRDVLITMGVRGAAVARSAVGRAALRMVLAESASEGVRAVVEGLLRAGTEPRRRLALAVARGEIRPGIDPSFIPTLLAGAVLQRSLVEQRPVTRGFVTRCVDAILSGVAPAPGRPSPAKKSGGASRRPLSHPDPSAS
jgi:AcrR family transcriptional regulator